MRQPCMGFPLVATRASAQQRQMWLPLKSWSRESTSCCCVVPISSVGDIPTSPCFGATSEIIAEGRSASSSQCVWDKRPTPVYHGGKSKTSSDCLQYDVWTATSALVTAYRTLIRDIGGDRRLAVQRNSRTDRPQEPELPAVARPHNLSLLHIAKKDMPSSCVTHLPCRPLKYPGIHHLNRTTSIYRLHLHSTFHASPSCLSLYYYYSRRRLASATGLL